MNLPLSGNRYRQAVASNTRILAKIENELIDEGDIYVADYTNEGVSMAKIYTIIAKLKRYGYQIKKIKTDRKNGRDIIVGYCLTDQPSKRIELQKMTCQRVIKQTLINDGIFEISKIEKDYNRQNIILVINSLKADGWDIESLKFNSGFSVFKGLTHYKLISKPRDSYFDYANWGNC